MYYCKTCGSVCAMKCERLLNKQLMDYRMQYII